MAKRKALQDITSPTQGLNAEYIQTLLRQKDFLEYVKGSFPSYEAGWVHKDICERLEKFSQDIVDGKNPRLMLFMPPRHGKSFLSSERFPVWHIGNNPSHNVIVSSYSSDLSQSFSKKALDLAQDDYTRKIFPNLVLDENKQASDEWATRSGGGYKSVGVGGSLTGRGAHCLIIDDPIKDWEQAISATVRGKVWNWYLSTAYTRLMPKSGVLVIQTRWHEEDLAGLLLKEMEDSADDPYSDKWEVVSYPAIAFEDEEYRKEGEALHPERYDIAKLEKIKKAVGPRVWSALYQQQPRPDGGRYINSSWFQRVSYDRVPKSLNWVRGWDLAVKAQKSNDETASSKVALDEDGNLWIAEQVSYKKVWGASKEHIVNLALQEGIAIGIESPGAMTIAIDEIKTSLQGSGIIVKEVFPDKDKLTRALPWIDLAERGKVFLVEGAWVQKFINQAEAFDPLQKKQSDDLIDSVTVGYEIIKRRRKARLIV